MLKLLVLAVAATVVVAEKATFDNYRVYRISPNTSAHIEYLQTLEDLPDGYSFWNGPGYVDADVDLMVAPHKIAEFEEFMNRIGVHYSTFISNVQALIDNENPASASRSSEFGWESYHTLEEIYAWLDSLEEKYPNNVKVVVGGTTYEGREIKGVKVSFAEDNPGIFIEGGIHAREWISPATITYILNELLTSSNKDVRALAERHDWYIFPNFNPDGFVYTHTTNRLWRKTRAPGSARCYGADPNRNWGFQWMTGGSSSMPCMETYAGSAPFSEIETRTMSEYISSISNKIYAYIAFHSYSQLLLLPYGHSTEHLDNFDDLYAIGIKAAASLESMYGTTYKTGNIAETIYVASGGSMDWVKATYNIPITYTYELRDVGQYGFVLPAEQIIPTAEETLASLITMFKEAKALGYPKLERMDATQ